MKSQKKKPDRLKRIKHIGYSMAVLPESYTLSEFVQYAKFQLCIRTRRLFKDPIWDLYTKEELLAEFYAFQFSINSRFLMDFEVELLSDNGKMDDFSAWADSMISKEDILRKRKMGELEDSIKFNPLDVMGAD